MLGCGHGIRLDKLRAIVRTTIVHRNDYRGDLGSFGHYDTSTIRGWKYAILCSFLIK